MPSDNFKAAALMTGSMAGYTFNDACMKVLSATMPLEQAVFLRGVATCVLLYVLGRYLGTVRFNLSAREWKLIGFRCIGEIGATYCFLTALFHMPIANVTAILQVLPLVIALAAWVFLSEPLGWRRLAAISVGFIGVLLIIQPGAGFSVWSLYALAAVVFITFRDLVVRKLSPETPSMTVAIMAAISITIGFGIASVGVEWVPVNGWSASLLGMAAFFIFLGYLFSVMVMRVGDIAFAAPFRYTGLIWALVLGLMLFSEWPNDVTLIGAGIVVGTGLFTLFRERRAAQR
ncbi:DMT family transporter [Aliiroseovarius sp. S1123]|uniref:DMT family transporter n=1 Tax=unclassified Aliiroseovarius TaxID=2623558 RepID=UPI001FF41FC4|nr:DMT family transporter [Aliiroseovarius sp. S1123]MCK0172494.1 DMT family transporter [Aliiroseovarius sp. S1123]